MLGPKLQDFLKYRET